METYDHIIIGTGQATGTLLGQLIPSGDSIAVIEGNKVGGSCVNYGCTPTKTLVASARAIHQARRGDFYGFAAGDDVRVNYRRIRERMNEVRNNSREGLVEWMESADNVHLIRGWGTFTGPREVKISDRTITGEKIYINTGTKARIPTIKSLEEIPYLDSAGLLDLQVLPEHLLIIGGGYVGVEFAQIYRRFGAQVTIIQRGKQLVPKEDQDVADTIREILEGEGVKVILEGQAREVIREGSRLQLTVESPDGVRVITGSNLLVAAGREPNTDLLGLDRAGIRTDDKGYIVVDDYCRTNVDGVFAVGDVNGRGAFTHTSVNDGEIVLDHLNGGDRKISDRVVVYALFSDPPLGRVGMTEKKALASGKRVLRAIRPMAKISRAKEMGETQGFAKLLVDAETDLIIGVAILGPGGDEVINMFAAIMHSGIPCREYRRVVLVHPTISELMPWVLDGLEEIG